MFYSCRAKNMSAEVSQSGSPNGFFWITEKEIVPSKWSLSSKTHPGRQKAFPASLFLQVSNWVNDATEYDKTQFQRCLRASKDRVVVLKILFQNILLVL